MVPERLIRTFDDEGYEADWVQRPSGLVVPEWVAFQQERPKAIDLFCGCGGMSCGLVSAGWEVLAGCDNDTLCAETYMHNLGTFPCQFWWIEPSDQQRMEKALQKSYFGHPSRKKELVQPFVAGDGWIANEKNAVGVRHFFLGDIRKLKGAELLSAVGLKVGELGLLAGSPPCQGFSFAGKRNVMDPRNSLVFEFARLVVETRPKTIMFENVPGILSMVTPAGILVVDEFCRILEDGGYGTVNAFKQAIGAQTGCVGLLRGRGKKDLVTEKAEARKPAPKQGALFA